LIGSGIRWRAFFPEGSGIEEREGRGEAEDHLSGVVKIASASPTTIVPTPSGPSVVSAASVKWSETSIPAGVNEE
jgi:hypothetical protein